MKLRLVREKSGGKTSWFIVTDIYTPNSNGKMGSGGMWCTPYRCRRSALRAIKNIYRKSLNN